MADDDTSETPGSAKEPSPSRDAYSWGLMLLPVASGVVLLSLEPSVYNLRVLALASVATAALVAADARRYAMPGYYAVATLFMYAGYPWYLHARTKHGAPNMLLPGLIASAFMFVGLYIGGGTLSQVVPSCRLLDDGNVVCELKNEGLGPGGSCFSLELLHDGGSATSNVLCTKTVWPNKTARQQFDGALPDAPPRCGDGCRIEVKELHWR